MFLIGLVREPVVHMEVAEELQVTLGATLSLELILQTEEVHMETITQEVIQEAKEVCLVIAVNQVEEAVLLDIAVMVEVAKVLVKVVLVGAAVAAVLVLDMQEILVEVVVEV